MRSWGIGLLLVVACGGHHEPAGKGSANRAGSAGSAVGEGSAGSATASNGANDSLGAAPSVTLKSAGAEPRSAFAYAPNAGERTATLEFSSGPEDMPKDEALAVAVTLAWTTPASAGAPYTYRVTDSKAIAPKDMKGGEAAIVSGVGAMFSANAGRVDADAQGRAQIVRTSDTMPTNPPLVWLIHPLIVPMPTEPIGSGASWIAKQTLSMQGQQGRADRTYTLVAVTDDALTIEVTGATHWSSGTGSDDDVVETVTGKLIVKPGDVLAQSAEITSVQDLGSADMPLKAGVHIKLQ